MPTTGTFWPKNLPKTKTNVYDPFWQFAQ
jgi:hypothetical protein